jgi:hypothetical protein
VSGYVVRIPTYSYAANGDTMLREKKALCAALALATGLGLFIAPANAATDLVMNGGFETGSFAGWSVGYTPDTNSICCMGFNATGGSKVQTSGSNLGLALAGTWSAYGDWDGGDGIAPTDLNLATDFFIRQLLTKTSDVTSATLSFQFQVGGGAYANYGANPGYGGIQKRNVTASFLAADLSPQASLFAWERDLMTGNEAFTTPVQTVSLDVTAAYNAMNDGSFYLDFGRHIPQYFTGAGYFVMDNASLSVGDAVAPPPQPGVVPEPATWALMIGGFGMAGATLRRRLAKATG